jgi:hypothetical protein
MDDTIFLIIWIASGIGALLIWRSKGGPLATGLGLGILGMFGLILAVGVTPERRMRSRTAGGHPS